MRLTHLYRWRHSVSERSPALLIGTTKIRLGPWKPFQHG